VLNRGVTVTQKVTMGVLTSAQMIYEAILGIGTREQMEQTEQMGKTEQTDLTEQTEQAADFAAASGVQKEQTKSIEQTKRSSARQTHVLWACPRSINYLIEQSRFWAVICG